LSWAERHENHLVCEDDPNNSQGFSSLLSLVRYNVLQARNGWKAIEICNNRREIIYLFVCDVDLPDLSGIEVALKVSGSCPALPILPVSGTPMNAWKGPEIRNFRRLPSELVGFLEKPFRLSTLREKVGELLHCVRHGSRQLLSE
jgi:CheY-like chemotaxis protein